MTRRALIGALAVVAAGAAAGLIWFFVAGNVGDPTPVTAPPITSEAPAATETTAQAPVTTAAPSADGTGGEGEAEDPSTEPSGTGEADGTAGSEGSSEDAGQTVEDEGPQEETEETAAEPVESADVVELELSEGTEARFSIYEVLRGEPFTVVGVTTEVVGRVRVDLADLSRSQMGEILINARTFATDASNRDRAIRGPILGAEQYEFITFLPTGITGLSGPAEDGGEYSFSVEGDLTVREITRAVTFSVAARWDGDGRLQGLASTTVSRSDFGLNIPSVPFVADVGDEIGLELAFTAAPAGVG
ncbi:MAG: YceI family protein [bacterium]|nr:YceI family protein [bacterium]MDE0600236.1 YceI family protein [bacterium]